MLISLAVDGGKVVVGEITPFLLDLALHLLPVPFDTIPVHFDLRYENVLSKERSASHVCLDSRLKTALPRGLLSIQVGRRERTNWPQLPRMRPSRLGLLLPPLAAVRDPKPPVLFWAGMHDAAS